MNIYLDIYGTLIASSSPIEDREALLQYILDNFAGHIYWLTSFSPERIANVLEREYKEPLLSRLISEIQYASYGYYKSDAIDFSEAFLWLDDNQSEADYYALKDHGVADSFIQIDPSNPEMSKKALEIIKAKQPTNKQ